MQFFVIKKKITFFYIFNKVIKYIILDKFENKMS